MTLVEAFRSEPESDDNLTWEQLQCFARWATKQGLPVEDVQDNHVPGGHLLIVHELDRGEAA